MSALRTRLSFLDLETRANPSGPELLDPYTPPGDTTVVDTTPPAPPAGIGSIVVIVVPPAPPGP